MTARQYLTQLRRIQTNIRILSEEIEIRRARLESTTVKASSERVQTSSRGDRFADMIAELADRSLQLEDMLFVYERLRDCIVRQILELEATPLQTRILYDYYFHGKQFVEIAAETHYSKDYIWRNHLAALDAFARQYQGKF